jgi:hypothetical protein
MEHGVESANLASIIAKALRIALADPVWVAATFVFLTIPPIWATLNLPEDDATRLSAILGVAGLVPQILLIERALWRLGLMQADYEKRPSFLARAFGQSFIAGVAIILGLVVLVIPGLVLLVRWSISLPVMIARNEGITHSLSSSWQLTADRFWLCLFSILLVWVPLVGLSVAIFLSAPFPALLESVVTETLLSIAILSSWFVSVALYAEITASKKMG